MITQRHLLTSLVISVSISLSAQVTFTDGSSLLPSTMVSDHAVGVIDMNGDGKDDIIRMDEGEEVFIAIQESPGNVFEQIEVGTMIVPGTGSANAWGLACADLDRNGRNDIVTGGFYNGVYVFLSDADNSTYDENIEIFDEVYVQGIGVFDIDNDGHLDIFVCHDHELSKVLTNDGTGDFDDIASGLVPESGPFDDNSGNYGVVFSDVDNNGHCDLYLTKCKQGEMDATQPTRINLLFLNDGAGNWTNAGVAANLNIGAQSWSSDFGDYDNDGDMDVIIANHDVNTDFLVNDGTGVFTEQTVAAGLQAEFPFLVIQTSWADFDNDGYIDILAMGNNEHRIAMNDGDGTFTVLDDLFLGYNTNSYALGDLNNDGFVDVYCTANGYAGWGNESIPDKMFFNTPNSNHYLNVSLTGVTSNINGIGARIEISGPWGVQIRDVKSGESYGIQNTLTQHFGTGAETMVDQLTVTWPSGEVDTYFDVPVDQQLAIVEGTSPSALADLINEAEVTIFPNPTEDYLSVQIDDFNSLSSSVLEFRVYDALGKVVLIEPLSRMNSQLDIQDLSSGIYTYSITADGMTIAVDEFVKQ